MKIEPELAASARRIISAVDHLVPNPKDRRRQKTVYRILRAYVEAADSPDEVEEQVRSEAEPLQSPRTP
jgi:hypothetical protein